MTYHHLPLTSTTHHLYHLECVDIVECVEAVVTQSVRRLLKCGEIVACVEVVVIWYGDREVCGNDEDCGVWILWS